MAFTQEQREQLVADIVANTKFDESDKEGLMELTDNQLVALASPDELDLIVNKAMAKKAKDEDMEDDDDDMEDDDETTTNSGGPMDLNQWMESAPPEVRQIVVNAQRIEADQRQKLINHITANCDCPLTKEQLASRTTEDLQLFAQMARKAPTNFLGAAGGLVTTNSGKKVEPLPLPGADYMAPAKS